MTVVPQLRANSPRSWSWAQRKSRVSGVCGREGVCQLNTGTMMTPVEPSSPAARTMSRMVVSNCAFTAGSSARMKPSKPAQMAETWMLRPFKASRISVTRPESPLPPGSKPVMPRLSMKSSFSARVWPGVKPSWKERFSGVAGDFFSSLAEAQEMTVPGAAMRAAAPAREVFKKVFLSIRANYLPEPGTGTVYLPMSILPSSSFSGRQSISEALISSQVTVLPV